VIVLCERQETAVEKPLVSHGPVNCARCWSDAQSTVQECGSFRLVRDPGHWGASNPHTLVLGISKGNTQSRAFGAEPFDSVAFKGIRHRILEAFHAVGLLLDETIASFERRFSESERDYAFASVIRCSITGMDRKKRVHTADSPNVLPAFQRGSLGSKFVENCVDQHLVMLPPRTKLVLLLGNTDTYVTALAEVIGRRRGAVSRINSVAYASLGVRFVHVAHPSKGNGHFGAFIRGEGKSGMKRNLARQALASPL
jgi:hypothetical protein